MYPLPHYHLEPALALALALVMVLLLVLALVLALVQVLALVLAHTVTFPRPNYSSLLQPPALVQALAQALG